jgi:hypothetical protein
MLYQKKPKIILFLIKKIIFFSASLFAKSKNPMLSHLYADIIEEEGGGGKAGGKKKGGSMQTISAIHRVSFFTSYIKLRCNRRELRSIQLITSPPHS